MNWGTWRKIKEIIGHLALETQNFKGELAASMYKHEEVNGIRNFRQLLKIKLLKILKSHSKNTGFK